MSEFTRVDMYQELIINYKTDETIFIENYAFIIDREEIYNPSKRYWSNSQNKFVFPNYAYNFTFRDMNNSITDISRSETYSNEVLKSEDAHRGFLIRSTPDVSDEFYEFYKTYRAKNELESELKTNPTKKEKVNKV